MKKILLCLIYFLTAIGSYAYDFEVSGLYFNIINSSSVELAPKTTQIINGATTGFSNYSGDFIIPSSITYGSKLYKVTRLGQDCFRFASQLTSVTIPSSIDSIVSNPFIIDKNLTKFYIEDGSNKFSTIDGILLSKDGKTLYAYPSAKGNIVNIPSTVTSFSFNALCDDSLVTSIELPKSLILLGEGCLARTQITSITIPSAVTTIGKNCFMSCNSLSTINIPSSIETIENAAFFDCTNLQTIICHSLTPPIVSSKTFYNVPNYSCKIYVPKSAVSTYKSTFPWSTFSIQSYSNPCSAPIISLTNNMLQFSCETSGAEYYYTIDAVDNTPTTLNKTGKIVIGGYYNISAYATADNYDQSDTTTATLYWLPQSDITNNINTTKTRGVLTSSNDGIVTLSGLNKDEVVTFYNTNGVILGKTTAINGIATYATTKNQVIIAKFGVSNVKIIIK